MTIPLYQAVASKFSGLLKVHKNVGAIELQATWTWLDLSPFFGPAQRASRVAVGPNKWFEALQHRSTPGNRVPPPLFAS